LESEEWSETISLPARRAARASAWALLALQRPYGKFSWSGMSTHDGLVAGSHAMTHGDVEFELEADLGRCVDCRAKFCRIFRRGRQ
jgi:hypothetical protein